MSGITNWHACPEGHGLGADFGGPAPFCIWCAKEREDRLRAAAPEVAPESIEIVDAPVKAKRNVLVGAFGRIRGVLVNYSAVRA